MREHEVPTHVQAEDKVLLGFTFPQVVAVTAVCAISYGAYRYAPVGPSEVRMALAAVLGLVGVAMVVGKIGGRRLPLVAADLLKYRLGARLYAGPVSQLVRSEPPAPPQPVKSGPGPLRLMARRSKRVLRRLRKKNRKDGDRRNGRRPFRPHGWFGKRRRNVGRDQQGHRAETLESRRKPRTGWVSVVAVVAVMAAAVMAVPQLALADGHEPWRDEIDFEITEPVEGRRIFVEGLTVSGDRALATLRAATDVDIRIRAFGGPDGTWLRFWASDRLDQGEISRYRFPLHGPVPSFTVSWEDALGQAGALTVEHDRIPYPLPEVEGELCDLRMTSLGWTPGAVNGVVESECVTRIEHPVELQTVAGTRQRHRDGCHGRRGDGHRRDARRSHRRVAGERRIRPQRRDQLPARCADRRGGSRRERGRELGGQPAHPHSSADRAHPPPGADRAPHRDGEPVAAGGQRHRQRDDHRDPRRRHDDGAHRHCPRVCAPAPRSAGT